MRFAFLIFDDDGNGVITKEELARILRANHMTAKAADIARMADMIMKVADKDGGNTCSFDEFAMASKKFPNILFPAS